MTPAEVITALAALAASIGAVAIAYLSYKAKVLSQNAESNARKAEKTAGENQATLIRIDNAIFEVGQRVDGRLSELLDAAKTQGVTDSALARAEGVAAGEKKQRDRE
jgi:Flp pilus assembly protein TadB